MLEENVGRDNVRPDSDSDSDGSEGRSLELASSHSSDEEDSSAKIQRNRRINGTNLFLLFQTLHLLVLHYSIIL